MSMLEFFHNYLEYKLKKDRGKIIYFSLGRKETKELYEMIHMILAWNKDMGKYKDMKNETDLEKVSETELQRLYATQAYIGAVNREMEGD